MSKFDHFNAISSVYDRIFGRGSAEEILTLAEVNENCRVLDVGGGTGRVSAIFNPHVKSIQVADAALKMLHEAQGKAVRVVAAESESLPYAAGVFDRVLMVDAFHHVANQQRALAEMWRVLASGGRIIIEEPDIRNFWVKWIALGEKILLMRSHFLQAEEIAAMVTFGEAAHVKIRRKKGIAWVIISKQPDTIARSI